MWCTVIHCKIKGINKAQDWDAVHANIPEGHQPQHAQLHGCHGKNEPEVTQGIDDQEESKDEDCEHAESWGQDGWDNRGAVAVHEHKRGVKGNELNAVNQHQRPELLKKLNHLLALLLCCPCDQVHPWGNDVVFVSLTVLREYDVLSEVLVLRAPQEGALEDVDEVILGGRAHIHYLKVVEKVVHPGDLIEAIT